MYLCSFTVLYFVITTLHTALTYFGSMPAFSIMSGHRAAALGFFRLSYTAWLMSYNKLGKFGFVGPSLWSKLKYLMCWRNCYQMFGWQCQPVKSKCLTLNSWVIYFCLAGSPTIIDWCLLTIFVLFFFFLFFYKIKFTGVSLHWLFPVGCLPFPPSLHYKVPSPLNHQCTCHLTPYSKDNNEN